MTLPSQARAVIIGGGVVGCSLAYHLTKLGWKDVLLLERKQLTSGTTWHAAGLIGQLRATSNMTKLAQYTTNLYSQLEEETGQAIGFKQNGSLSIATGQGRFEELKRGASMAKTFGLDVEVLDPDGLQEKYALLNTSDLVGGVFLPNDGQLNPADVTLALAKGARSRGATLLEGVKVTGVHQKDGRVTGVATDQGDVMADFVVNCAGMWGRELGEMAGVKVPLQACEHFYIVTEPVKGLPDKLPVLRDPGACAYFKEDAGKILLGCFEPVSKPWALEGIPEDFCFDELPEDFDHFAPILEKAMVRLPILAETGIRTFFNGPESFTPDDRFHLGEAPELKNFYVAAGFNSIGIQSAGGAGKALAEWMDAGHPTMDLWDVDIRRMQPFQNNKTYLTKRVTESLGLLYAMHWPYRQYESARDVRHSPLHEKLKEKGAVFGETAGWERANWFAPKGVEPKYVYSYKRQNWFEHAAAEHKALREGVGFFDMTSFAKFRVEGPDAEAVLQRISAADLAVEPGRVVYTQWLNDRGGIEADLTITRLSETAFMVVTAGASAQRDLSWLRRHTPEEARCVVVDVTDSEAVLEIMGPKSRAVLQKITDADLSNEAFAFGTAQEIDLGMAYGRAQRISYVGELGWELYVPSTFARGVFDALWEAGAPEGLKLCGLHVLDSGRIEKAFRHFGHDITDEDTTHQAGLSFVVKPDKARSKFGDFLGRDAFLKEQSQPRTKRMVQFLLNDPEPLLYHNEPVWRGGEIVGYLSSGNYGHHLGAAVGMGYLHHAETITQAWLDDQPLEIEVAGERFQAKGSLKPLYDPKGERIKM
tara:strand:- start:79 stop:2532 length:2454 start_codon:yes stop_codon:yes gene_type:complete